MPLHKRKAVRVIREIGERRFFDPTKRLIQYLTTGKTATVPASELYEASEPDAIQFRDRTGKHTPTRRW